MKEIVNKINLIYKGSIDFEAMARLRVFKPYSNNVLQFLNRLSMRILKDGSLKQYNDVVSFAFFIRKSNLVRLMKEVITDDCTRLGKGLVFHIAPSNVPINFAYSLVAGLLSGSANIVKVSSKEFPQVRMLCRIIAELLAGEEFKGLRDYIAIIQYGNEKEVNDFFSSICNVRMIWGGNRTIKELRKSTVSPRCSDITFANRYSLCLINAESYLDMENKKECAIAFYNDTYGFDQNACFSPRMVYWSGKARAVEQSRTQFWEHLHNYAQKRYEIDDSSAFNKYMAVCREVLTNKDVTVDKMADNLIVRCTVKELSEEAFHNSCSGGYFIEYIDEDINALEKVLSVEIQTLSYIGYNAEELANFITEKGLYGVDRIKKTGSAHEFSFIWDGINMITELTRIINY